MSAAVARIAIGVAVACLLAGGVVFAATDGESSAPGRATDSWAALAPSPLERTEVGAARIRDRIYVVGGFESSGGTTGEMVAYDVSEDRWLRRASLPIAVNHPGVTALGRKLYLLGGNRPHADGTEEQSARLYAYSPRRNRWLRLRDAPTGRAALALVAIDGRLYAVGGASATSGQVRKLEIYDPKRNYWRRGAPMPTGRNHIAAGVLVDREMIVTGGRPGPIHGNLDTVESYDAKRDRWRTLPPLGTARSGHAAVSQGGLLAVFGGEELDGGTTIEQVEAFGVDGRVWTPLPEMVTPRHGVGGAELGKRVFALEGGPQPGLSFSGALEYLDVP